MGRSWFWVKSCNVIETNWSPLVSWQLGCFEWFSSSGTPLLFLTALSWWLRPPTPSIFSPFLSLSLLSASKKSSGQSSSYFCSSSSPHFSTTIKNTGWIVFLLAQGKGRFNFFCLVGTVLECRSRWRKSRTRGLLLQTVLAPCYLISCMKPSSPRQFVLSVTIPWSEMITESNLMCLSGSYRNICLTRWMSCRHNRSPLCISWS